MRNLNQLQKTVAISFLCGIFFFPLIWQQKFFWFNVKATTRVIEWFGEPNETVKD